MCRVREGVWVLQKHEKNTPNLDIKKEKCKLNKTFKDAETLKVHAFLFVIGENYNSFRNCERVNQELKEAYRKRRQNVHLWVHFMLHFPRGPSISFYEHTRKYYASPNIAHSY